MTVWCLSDKITNTHSLVMRDLLKLKTLCPVSYTHLDVYKRQPLTSVTLPASIKTLDAQIFYQSGDVLMGTPGSSPVKEATILATNAPEMSSNVFQYGETTIYVPKGATGYTGCLLYTSA